MGKEFQYTTHKWIPCEFGSSKRVLEMAKRGMTNRRKLILLFFFAIPFFIHIISHKFSYFPFTLYMMEKMVFGYFANRYIGHDKINELFGKFSIFFIIVILPQIANRMACGGYFAFFKWQEPTDKIIIYSFWRRKRTETESTVLF